jgi:peptidoglycan/xylan/chitin deacetylase (PgdA/CDA1 family)
LTRRLLTTGLALALFWGLGLVFLRLINDRDFQFYGNLTHRVETSRKLVALTLDDAPGQANAAVLKLLADKGVKATFYAIGEGMERQPDQAAAIVAQGHELGNHSYSHRRMVFKRASFYRDEVEKTNALIRKAGYTGEIIFRPPYGKKLLGLPRYLSQAGMRTVTWDLEPDSLAPGDAEGILAHVLQGVRPGSIILLHPFCAEACEADRAVLPRVIDALRAQGYAFVTVTELLKAAR